MDKTDFSKRSFSYYPTKAIVIAKYEGGAWGKPEITDDFNLSVHCFAGAFHYAPECFEGLKVFRGADNRVRMFRPEENARRMQSSAGYLDMASPSEEMFIQMCIMCVKANWEFIPPYESGASLYLRPVLFGSNPQLGIRNADDVTFVVMASPVGTYSGARELTPGTAVLSRNFDRAATYGSGHYKLGANYAQSLHAYNLAHKLGYRELLFLDSATHTYIEEFGSSNFFGIKGNTYVTPDSGSVLPSITNKSLRQVAADMGLKVEMRKISVAELAELDEANSCGTAVVITPLCRIDDKPALESEIVTRSYNFGNPEQCGPVSRKLYNTIVGIQKGLLPDKYGRCLFLD